MSLNKTRDSMDWHELHETALNQCHSAYQNSTPSKEEWLETYKEFYDELLSTNRITMYPVDPPGSRRMGISRATVVWADDYSD